MNTIKPGLDYGDILREERDADRMGTVPLPPPISDTRGAEVDCVRNGTQIGAEPVLGNEADYIEVGAEDPFVLPEETVMLGLARIADIKQQLAERKASRPSSSPR